MTEYVKYYLVIMNVITFLLYWIDKRKAVRHKWRIKESVLLGCSAIGGAFGGFLAMRTFHHKTRKWYFAYGVPLMIILQVAILYRMR